MLNGRVIAVVAHPDAVDVLDVFQVAHGAERDVDDAVQVVVALLHLGLEDSYDLEAHAVQTDVSGRAGSMPEKSFVLASEPMTATWARCCDVQRR